MNGEKYMIYPKFPKSGDTIGICAPSAGVGSKIDSFDLSLEFLHESGFKTRETESVRIDDCPSAPADARGAEFNQLFADPEISMVMSASGGDYNVEMLPCINPDIVRENPKWFAGYSDPTCIELYLTTVLDIATIYGVNAGAWDWRPLHKFQYDALSIIKGDLPVQTSYDFYSSKGFDDETLSYEMDAEVVWSLLVPVHSSESTQGELFEETSLDVSGRLIGGCIDVITWVMGTPYEDLEGFAERYKDDGLIWFFDNFALNPMDLMYAMIKMRHAGLFDSARVVIFGRTLITGDASDEDYLIQLERVFGELELPVIWNADIGHTKPSMTLINGAMAHLVYNDGKASISMELI